MIRNKSRETKMINARFASIPNPWRFFALALGLSWFFWLWVILLDWNVWTYPAVLFGALGLFGPALAEIILISRAHDKDQWRDYWQRVFDIKRIGGRWHAVIWLTPLLLNIVAILIGIFTGWPPPEFETVNRLLSAPWDIIPFIIFILLLGPLPEELGWRGFALDGLQARYNAIVSSLILGTMWALWHVPLFFMKGTPQHDQLGFATISFWTYILSPVILSFLFTWIYNSTSRSTLSAILFHFMLNLTAELIPLNKQSGIYSFILVVVSTIVIIFWRAGWSPPDSKGREMCFHETESL
jgi:membrane protease YdiL (CAAX protease family)